MGQITPVPFVLRDYIFQVGTDTFEKAITSAKFTPSYTSLTIQGGTPDATFVDVSTPTWVVALAFMQDWTTAGSLSNYLLTNSGQRKTVLFKPQGAATGKPIFTVDLMIQSGEIGGDNNTFMTSPVTMACFGQPIKTVA